MKRLLLILAIAASAFADHPTKERGFRADSLYQFTDLDTINLYNGSVNVMLPVGQTYAVTSNLSYSFALRYASNMWSEVEVCGGKEGDACHVHYTWRRDNAGFGWNLSFGEYEEGKLTTPDGSEHQFYATLHDGETVTTGVLYTRDGTYLRETHLSATTRLIEFPNGVRQLYEYRTENGQWFLRYMYDTFSSVTSGIPTTNYVSIVPTFATDPADGYTYASQWTITDSVGRTHYVYFKRTLPAYYESVDRIQLQTFNGVAAVYDLGYNLYTDGTTITDGPVRVISRPCHISDLNASISVNLLRKIRLTKGNPASSTEPFTAFTMEYDEGISGGCSATSGLMTSMTLPTLGRYAWNYRTYNFASLAPFDESVGVSKRLVYDKAGHVIQSRHYDAASSAAQNTIKAMKVSGTATDDSAATVDFKAVHYFDSSDGLDAGLPFTASVTDGTATVRYLSSETFDCNENSATESCNATPERRSYVKYERDTCSIGTCSRDTNRRVLSERTQYTSDGSRSADTNRTAFDGLGHYRTMTTAGTFDAGNVRTETTNYNPSAGTYPSSFTAPLTTSPWLLETYSDKTLTEGSSTSKSQYCFNAANGAIERVRTQAGTAIGANDLLSVFLYDTAGNVTGERYYGGDMQTISTGTTLCTLTLPSSIPYRIAHTYQYGARKTSEYQTGSGASAGFKFADYDIDQSTGWIKTARDSAGFATAFEFDALGRLLWELPAVGGDAYTEYVYTPATSSALATVGVNKRPNNNRTGAYLTRAEYKFDDLGRLWQERSMMYNYAWNLKETGYDYAGRKAYETITGPDVGITLQRTSYVYDLFGRPTTATLPDGHTVTTAYTGVRQVDRTGTVKSTGATEIAATTTEVYDRQGRLYQVKEPSRPDGTNATTTYTYNSLNKLTGVSIAGQEGTQTRSFTYDGRGFLNSESHPESGTTSYLYDSRGHVRKRADASVDMRTLYDVAERPSLMYEATGAVWKEFTYSTSNTLDTFGNVTDWSKGKITQAVRHNPFPEYAEDIVVTEAYVYGGRNGRMSRRDTSSSEGTAFTQSFTYNDLGLILSQGYPACTATCPASAMTLTNNYTNGYLTSIVNYSGAISYHPNGQVYQASYGAGSIVWTQLNDPNRMTRPSSITLTGPASANWSSGTYQYDGAGNIFAIGTDTYVYDKVSRLVSASIASGSTQNTTYDSFGNIKSLATGGVSRTMAMNGLTNQLASITDAGTTTSVAYDTRGNVTSLRGNTFEYDALGMPRTAGGATRNWVYIYTPGEERIWAYDLAATRSTWTVRGLDNKPLAEWTNDGITGWSGPVYYIYRNGTLHASYAAGRVPATMFYAVDHLGTPRKIVDPSGNAVGTHTYYPFGQEQTNSLQNTQRLKFTSHERDFCCDGTNDSIDFMHARQYSGWGGRFLSVDPVNSASPSAPQSWNRYSYARNNPVALVDRNGMWPTKVVHTHQNAIDFTLRTLPAADRQVLKQAQVTADLDQRNQYKHAMRNPGQSPHDAANLANKFIDTAMNRAVALEKSGNHAGALLNVGLAMHTLQDNTSPVHMAVQEFDPNKGNLSGATLGHVQGELYDPSGMPQHEGVGENLDRATYDVYAHFANASGLPVPPVPQCDGKPCFEPSGEIHVEVPPK